MCSNKEAMTYRDAGVDIDAGNKAVELMKAACFGFISTDVTFWQPREANSKEIEPIPAKRSSTALLPISKLKRFSMMLKRASLAKSVVGLTSKFLGAEILFDFHLPLIILYIIKDCWVRRRVIGR